MFWGEVLLCLCDVEHPFYELGILKYKKMCGLTIAAPNLQGKNEKGAIMIGKELEFVISRLCCERWDQS